MEATIQPLKGKYYGTAVAIRDDKGNETEIVVWMMGDHAPSRRQIEAWGYTQEQWDTNALVDDGWGGKAPCRQLAINDSHYESRDGYAICEKIAAALSSPNHKNDFIVMKNSTKVNNG